MTLARQVVVFRWEYTRVQYRALESNDLMNMNLKKSIGRLFALVLTLSCTLVFSSSQSFAQSADGFKIMSYNVRNGRGLDEKTDYARISAVINAEKPEVAAIQELDQKTRRSNGVDVLEEFAKLTNMIPLYGPAINYQGGKYGIGILSKEKPLSVKYYPLPGREEERCLLVAEFEKFVFCCSHWSLTEEDRDATVGIVTAKMKEQKKPVFICGDFNAELNEKSIKELKKNWTTLNSDAPTFPANKPAVHIDYICGADPNGKISADDWKKAIKKTYVVDEKVASDHRPIVVVLDSNFLK